MENEKTNNETNSELQKASEHIEKLSNVILEMKKEMDALKEENKELLEEKESLEVKLESAFGILDIFHKNYKHLILSLPTKEDMLETAQQLNNLIVNLEDQ